MAQGVKLLTLKEGEKSQDISPVIPDGEDESERGLQSASVNAGEVPTQAD